MTKTATRRSTGVHNGLQTTTPRTDVCRFDDIMPHTDKGHVALSRAGLAAFHAARDTGACAEYAIACYLEAAAKANA